MPDFAAPRAFAPLEKALGLGGDDLLTDSRRLEAILADLGGQDRLGCNLVVMACRAGIPAILTSSMAPDEAHSRSVSVLVSDHGVSKKSAEWTVAAWTTALVNSGNLEARELQTSKPADADRKAWQADPGKAKTKVSAKSQSSIPNDNGSKSKANPAKAASSGPKPIQTATGSTPAVSSSSSSSRNSSMIWGGALLFILSGAVGTLGTMGYLHIAASHKIAGLKAKASEELQAEDWGMYRLTLLHLASLGDRDTIKKLLKSDYYHPSLDRGLQAAAAKCSKGGDKECTALLAGHRLFFNQSVADDQSSFKDISRLAEADNPIALSFLGRAYLTGKGVKQDEVFGLQRLRIAASSGDAFAVGLAGGILYSIGSPMYPKGSSEGLQYLELAANKGSHTAATNLALARLYNAKDNSSRANAVELMRRTALRSGEPLAHEQMAYVFESGIGVLKDMGAAYKHAAAAAELGNPRAMARLGRYRLFGLGIEQNNSNAVYWLQKSDSLGDPYARALLAYCSLYGAGVPKSSSDAYRLAQSAAASSDAGAIRLANSILKSIPKR